ncbi:MIP/aquaporin family protein [Dictyobacter aurantiacus]|uniref:Aquaporin n=1 Tax=Dictyobacter aurantiacus TaxID=1936993 RepID=A0A401ZS85_9CHLR|nr:MIP/aquaporin family protein [Dictyobacter aurantiacus]GCE09654.1 aquaporin [Dictyobacter aurantiacus]
MDNHIMNDYVNEEPEEVDIDAAMGQRVTDPSARGRNIERKGISAVVAELIGSFLFVFVGVGSVMANTWMQGAVGLPGIAVAHGLALAVLITIFGATSGGHFNPAVTIAFLVARRIKSGLGFCYIVAHLLGAVFAALLLRVVFPAFVWKAAQLGTPALSNSVSIGAGIAVEALLTFFLLLAIYGTAIDTRAPKFGGFSIGLTMTACILGGGVLTGGIMNPARAFGPALMSGIWTNQFVYWIGPIVGAVLAACVYESLILPRSQHEALPLEQSTDSEESVVPQQVQERNFEADHSPFSLTGDQ